MSRSTTFFPFTHASCAEVACPLVRMARSSLLMLWNCMYAGKKCIIGGVSLWSPAFMMGMALPRLRTVAHAPVSGISLTGIT